MSKDNSITVYCTCKFEPSQLFLKVSFFEGDYYNSILNHNNNELFMVINNIKFNDAINYIKREVKKQHIKADLLNESKNILEYKLFGDMSLNFDKIRRSIQYLNETF